MLRSSKPSVHTLMSAKAVIELIQALITVTIRIQLLIFDGALYLSE
jgi:hypothetical protein